MKNQSFNEIKVFYNMISRNLLFVFLLLTASLSKAQSTDTALKRLLSNVKELYTLNPIEKCFVHTDKTFYQPGEKIWFIGYLMFNQLPSSFSKVMYTDFTDAKGKLIAKDMWQVKEGLSEGLISLPDTLQTGIYRLRAYSLWMLNEPSTIGEHYIFIQGKDKQHKEYLPQKTTIKVGFFPESGQIAYDVPNRVAFTVTDAFGIPASVSSIRLSENDRMTEADFALLGNGLGTITFTPKPDLLYSLQLQHNGEWLSFQLPAAQKKAISLQVSNFSTTRIFVQAFANDAFIQEYPRITLIALQNGKLVFDGVLQLDEAQNATMITKKGLSNDLLQVLLLDPQHKPIAQRWIQVQGQEVASIISTPKAINTRAKELNRVQLQFSGNDTPKVSVSVVPADLPSPNYLQNSDIKGYVTFHAHRSNSPLLATQFASIPDSLRNAYSDALTMTIQADRFSWSDIENLKLSQLNYFYETGISVRGFVKDEKTTPNLNRVDIITKGVDSTTILSTVQPDARGAFAVNDLGFRKRASIFAQGSSADKKGKKLSLRLLPGYIDTLTTIPLPEFAPVLEESKSVTETTEAFLKQYALTGFGKSLDEIVITGKRKPRIDSLNEAYTSDLFRQSDYTYELDSNFSYVTIWQALMELVPGIYVSSATANEPMVSFNRYTLSNDRIAGEDGTNSVAPVPIAFFLNEVPIELFEVSSINPSDVALIKVNRSANLLMNSGSMYSGAEGSILIYTKKNTGRNKSSFDEASLTGYSLPIPFNGPQYNNKAQLGIEDKRTTLLWIPHVNWNADGTAMIEFYNNDYAKKFKLVVQGFDAKGNLYYLEKILE